MGKGEKCPRQPQNPPTPGPGDQRAVPDLWGQVIWPAALLSTQSGPAWHRMQGHKTDTAPARGVRTNKTHGMRGHTETLQAGPRWQGSWGRGTVPWGVCSIISRGAAPVPGSVPGAMTLPHRAHLPGGEGSRATASSHVATASGRQGQGSRAEKTWRRRDVVSDKRAPESQRSQ